MSVDADKLRTDLQEFADTERYPDDMIAYWLAIAVQLVDPGRWSTLADVGVELFTAHNLVLERRAMDEAARGKIPGQTPGIVNNKSVDKVSVGYDTQGGAEMGAGHWNLTIYGSRYIRLARMMGRGGVQVGAGCSSMSSASAYVGPWPYNFPNPS